MSNLRADVARLERALGEPGEPEYAGGAILVTRRVEAAAWLAGDRDHPATPPGAIGVTEVIVRTRAEAAACLALNRERGVSGG